MKTKMTIENTIKLNLYDPALQMDEVLLIYGSLVNFIGANINVVKQTNGKISFKQSWEILWSTYLKHQNRLPLYFKIGFGSSHLWVKQIDPKTGKTLDCDERLIFVEFETN